MIVTQDEFFEPPQITDQASYFRAWQQAEDVFSLIPDEASDSEAWFQALCDAEVEFGLVDNPEKLRCWRRNTP